MLPLSVLDLAPIVEGGTAADAFRNSLDLAQHAERWGYRRYWLAEHHNMPGIGSAATAVLIGHIGAGTTTIRIGAGGIMLPNHAPLQVAEQFGTLASLFPGRIDLGLGRAPGTDAQGMRALRRDPARVDEFPQDVQELQAFLAPVRTGQSIQAVPGGGLNVPLWILGSSTFGAQLAAHLGLPYAFASHFAPDALHRAVEVYRETFRPSAELSDPYVIAGVNVFAADDHSLAVSQMKVAYRHRTRAFLTRGPLGGNFTDAEIDEFLASPQGAQLAGMTRYTAAGTPDEVRDYLTAFAAGCHADELITTHQALDIADRVRSIELLGAALGAVGV
jgi:putative transposase